MAALAIDDGGQKWCWPIWWQQHRNWPMHERHSRKITAYKLDEIAAAKAALPLAEVEKTRQRLPMRRVGFARIGSQARCRKARFNCRDKKGVAVERAYS